MASIIELWTAEDTARLAQLVEAVDQNDALAAVLALNPGNLDPIVQAVHESRDRIQQAADFGGILAVSSTLADLIDTTWGIALDPDHALAQECDLVHCWTSQSASPRTLALFWVFAATELGFDAYWLEMGVFHPVVLAADGVEMMVDSSSGRLVTRGDCVEVFEAIADEGETFDPGMFDTPDARAIVDDILDLRLAGAAAHQDEVGAYRQMRCHVALHPDDHKAGFAVAMAAARIGDHEFAVRSLEQLIERAKDTDLAMSMRQALKQIQAQASYKN